MWSEEKAHLKTDTGGYDYQFVEEPPDSLKCLICLQVARDPQQHGGCGKLFCQSCITTYRVMRNECPHCRQPLSNSQETTIFNDFRSDQEVRSLWIACSKSCGWKGELRSLDDHLAKECENALIRCPNVCGSGNTKIMRKNLKYHLDFKCPRRKQTCDQCGQLNECINLSNHRLYACPKRQYSCPNCNEAGCYDERTTIHLEVCTKVKIQCPKCSIQIFRTDNDKHSLTCTHESVPCKYYDIGCMKRPLRKDAKKHEEDAQFHLTVAIKKVLELTNTQLQSMLTFKLTDFKKRKDTNERFYSPHFFTSRSGYKLCVCVVANGLCSGKGTHVSVFACLMKGDNDDSLTWPFTGTVAFELLNQLEDKNHHKMSVKFLADNEASKRVVNSDRAVQGYGQPQFISYANLNFVSETNCQYLNDDTLVFRVSAKAPNYKPWLECTTPQ